jgi:hypothetical protein
MDDRAKGVLVKVAIVLICCEECTLQGLTNFCS